MPEEKIRVLMSKPGIDGHWRGIVVVSRGLRDAGMEVIYTGLHQTAEMIVEAALQEDVDVIAISILSGAHMTVFPRVIDLMKEKGLQNVLLTGGGIIPQEEIKELEEKGVGKLFGPGTPTTEPVAYIKNWVAKHRS